MSKTLLIGPARSGKTHALLNDFEKTLKSSKDPLLEDSFFLLPSAEHTERIITRMLQRGIKGFFHERITTLSRLTAKVFGMGREGVVTNVTRTLILREILEAETWPIFENVQKSSGFLNLVLSFILELKESLISVSDFREKLNQLKRFDPELASKYEALAAIYEAYTEALKEKGLRDPQDTLWLYRQKNQEAPRLKFRKVWMDGFFDFTPLQLAYLEELSKVTDEMVITLTYDPAPERSGLFEAVQQTKTVLEQMGFKTQLLKPSNVQTPAPLMHIERHLFSSSKPKTSPPLEKALEIFEAIGVEGEVEMIARKVESLYRSGDYRLSDFAILLRQVGDYEGVIRSVFSRYDLPVEIHERERLGFAPMIQVIVGLLKIFREGWKRYDLIEFLKSSYVARLGKWEKESSWVEALEHRSLREGVFKGREAWLGLDSDEDSPKLEVLSELEDTLLNASSVLQMKQALKEAASKTFGIFKKQEGFGEHVRRDGASFKRFEAILDEIERSFFVAEKSGSAVSFEAFADRFLNLAQIDLYSLHEKDKNKVQVYDVSLARQKEYRVVFLAGLLEKRFPVQMKEDPLLSDWERELFNGLDAPGELRQQLSRQKMERYLFYVALTRSQEKLILSYPRLDLEGKEYLPSYYVEEVRALFFSEVPCQKQKLARPYPELHEIVTERELEMAVLGELWNPSRQGISEEPLILYLANELLVREKNRSHFKRSFYEIPGELSDPEILSSDAFGVSRTSATKLEEYAKCPFKYYSKRILKLEDPEEDINVMRRGTIVHDVLEHFFGEWVQKPGVFKEKSKRKKWIAQRLGQAMDENPLLIEKKYQWHLEKEDMQEMIEYFLEEELLRLQGFPLKPKYFEYGFGVSGSESPCFELAWEGGKIKISGKVDRVDLDAEEKIAVIIDYKRTKAAVTLSQANLDLGISLQLPIYVMAMQKFLGLPIAGAELYAVRERERKGFYHADHKALLGGLSRQRMVFKEKEFREILDKASNFIQKFVEGMRQMKIPVRPRSCDSFCPYPSVCRIEKWKLPTILKEIQEEDQKEKELCGKQKKTKTTV